MAEAKVKAWPDALRNLSASLSATLSLHQALVALGHSGPSALRPVFERYARLSGTLDQRAALQVVREELADPVSDRVVEVLILASEQGPSIVLDVLADLARATTLDLQLGERIETAQFEQRLNARAVFVLPYFILVLLCATGESSAASTAPRWASSWSSWAPRLSPGGMLIIRRLGRIPSRSGSSCRRRRRRDDPARVPRRRPSPPSPSPPQQACWCGPPAASPPACSPTPS